MAEIPRVARCLSVVMPCFNEATTIKAVAERVLASPFTTELIIVDDGSTDGTLEQVRGVADPRLRVLVQPRNQGKGAALRRGFAEATAPFVVVQDADLEYDPADFEQLLAPLIDDRADVVYGSRFHTARPHRVLYFWHSVGNRILTAASNMFTNLNLSDMETCYKAFRREVLDSFEIEEDRFGFEPEITAKVARGGWRIYEVGISYAGRTYAEGKKIGWRDGVRAMYCIVRYSRAERWVRDRLGRGPVERARPSAFEEADVELAETLHSLRDAHRYTDWIFDLMAPHLGADVLEIGAGHGSITDRLARHPGVTRLTVTDLSERCAGILAERYRDDRHVAVHRGDIGDSVALGEHDTIVLVNVLEHLEDDVKALAQLAGGLRPGGRLVLFVPAFEMLYSDFDRRIGHHRRYRSADLASAVTAAGLEVVEVRYVNSVGALAWWLLAKQLRQTPTRRWSVVTYDRLVVPLLRRIEDDRRPPFGQSAFCVARRPS